MSDKKRFTVEEAHKAFAVGLNNLVWQLLGKEDRTDEENDRMINAAHASHYHWSTVGEAINLQRGHWMISHVYAVLNRAEPALFHARKCMELTEKLSLVDFDLAYAYEAIARANAAAGNEEEGKNFMRLADEAGKNIQKEDDKKIFDGDFAAGPWYGLK